MKVLIFHFRSSLSFDEVMKKAEEREKQYKEVPGMDRIIYMKDERTNEYGSILFFEDEEDLNKFRISDLAKTLKKEYNVEGFPEIRIFDVIKQLTPEEE
ncbi:MAG: YdhR family protein [Candidatus Heimdallarchaeaceae archaeon]